MDDRAENDSDCGPDLFHLVKRLTGFRCAARAPRLPESKCHCAICTDGNRVAFDCSKRLRSYPTKLKCKIAVSASQPGASQKSLLT